MTIKMELEEFKKELEKIIEHMIKVGLMAKLDPGKIKDLANNVATTLQNNTDISLYKNDLQNDKTREALGLACQAQLTQEKNPNFKFNYALLFKDQKDMTEEQKKQLNLDLKNELKNLFKEMNKYFPQKSPDADKKLDELAGILADKLLKNDDGMVAENKNACALISGCIRQLDQMEEQRRELYGVDTHITGGQFIPIQAIPEGNKGGLLDMAFEGGKSFMGEALSADPGEPDPLGIKMANIVNDIATGALSMGLEEKLVEDKILTPEPSLSNWPPRPMMPGSGNP